MRLIAACLALGLLSLSGGCSCVDHASAAADGTPLPKSFFQGSDDPADAPVFRASSMVLDVTYGDGDAASLPAGLAAPMLRIRWEITEDVLAARVVPYPGADVAQVMHAYAITRHYDLLQTPDGEQHVDTTSRPWSEREYFDVDWSQDLVPGSRPLDLLARAGFEGSVAYESLALFVTDPAAEEAPRIDLAGGYLDVTGKVFAMFGDVDIAGVAIPASRLGPTGLALGGAGDVAEAVTRTAFWRVDAERHEPAEWDGGPAAAIGGVRISRQYEDGAAAGADVAARHAIWETAHARDADGTTIPCAAAPDSDDAHTDLDGDGTEDSCAAIGRGSRCDRVTSACTLPYRERTPRPMPVFLLGGGEQEIEAVRAAAMPWDVALRSAVLAARYAECVRAGESDCAGRFPIPTGQVRDDDDATALAVEVADCLAGRARADLGGDPHACAGLAHELAPARGATAAAVAVAKAEAMLVVCQSPVTSDDPAACGEPGKLARRGDPREWIIDLAGAPREHHHLVAAAGIDPWTGEIVSAHVHIDVSAIDQWSAHALELLRQSEGELGTGDIEAWLADAEAVSVGISAALDAPEVLRRLADFADVDPQGYAAVSAAADADPVLALGLVDARRRVAAVSCDAAAPTSTSELYTARRLGAVGSEVEPALASDLLAAAGDGAPVDDLSASPLRALHPEVSRTVRLAVENALARSGACLLEDPPSAATMLPLAPLVTQKFGAPSGTPDERKLRAERVWRWLRARMLTATVGHALGHTLGLGHNLAGSADARAYRPQYWQLRTHNGSAAGPCAPGLPPSQCSGPRWLDPLDEAEIAQQIEMFASSSAMDLAGDARQMLAGPGAFDFAAVRALYAEVAPVLVDPEITESTAAGRARLAEIDDFGGALGKLWHGEGGIVDAASLQQHEALVRGCEPVDPISLRRAGWRDDLSGIWNHQLDGGLVEIDALWLRCRQPPVDLTAFRSLRSSTSVVEAPARAVDDRGRVRLPLLHAPDDAGDVGNPSANRRDRGADVYEGTAFLITAAELDPEPDRYRRGPAWSVTYGAWLRRLEQLRDAAKAPALLAAATRAAASANGASFDDAWALHPAALTTPRVLAAALAFEHFTRVAARPARGPHRTPSGDELLRFDAQLAPAAAEVVVPVGPRRLGGEISVAAAPSGGPCDHCDSIDPRSSLEKVFPGLWLAESRDPFTWTGDVDPLEGLPRAVSMAAAWPNAYRRWLAQLAAGDELAVGARLAASPAGLPLVDGAKLPLQPLGWVRWSARGDAEVCSPHAGIDLCSAYSAPTSGAASEGAAEHVAVLDPQTNAATRRQLLAWALLYMDADAAQANLPSLRVWNAGEEAAPSLPDRIELHAPDGAVWVARTDGKEPLFGAEVQRGVAARMLEHANALLAAAYEVTAGPDLDADGTPDWWLVAIDPQSNVPTIQYHPAAAGPGCTPAENVGCACDENPTCVAFHAQLELIRFLRSALSAFGHAP